MNAENTELRDSVLTLAGIALLLALMRESSVIVVPFLLSLFIAIIAATPFSWLKQRGLSTAVSVVIVVIAIAVVIALFASLLGSTVTQFEAALPVYQARLEELTSTVSTWAAMKGIRLDETGIFNTLNPSAVMDFANNTFVGIGNVLSNFFLILLTVMFMLIEAAGFPRKVAAIEGHDAETTLQRLAELIESVNRYVVAKAIVSLATGILIWLSLALVGLDFAPLWGFMAFLLNFVPNIGSLIAAAPAIMLAMLQLDPAMVLAVIGIYLVVNMLIGNIVEPMIMGQRVGLSTLAVFMSLVFWGWMFGPVGMLLSVPLSMVVKFVAQTNPQTQWIAVLLGPAPAQTDS
ncbi:MAG: AI-2E family transporter [Pseudomonadota bacterium]